MTSPNVSQASSILLQTALLRWSSADSIIAQPFGKLLKINTLIASNTTDDPLDVQIVAWRLGLEDYVMLSRTFPIAAKSSSVLIHRGSPVYLSEGDTMWARVRYFPFGYNANDAVDFVCSYEEISE